jgi:hypothetical protein
MGVDFRARFRQRKIRCERLMFETKETLIAIFAIAL